MKIYTNYLNLVYCVLIYFNVISMYDIPYGREQKHVLLFRKSILNGFFNLWHPLTYIPKYLSSFLWKVARFKSDTSEVPSFPPKFLSFCTLVFSSKIKEVLSRAVNISHLITLLLTLNPFNYKIWLDCCLFFYYQTPNIFWIVVLHNINDSPMRVEEEWVAFRGIEEGA